MAVTLEREQTVQAARSLPGWSAPVAFGAGFVLFVVLSNWTAFTSSNVETGDAAADSIRTRSAWTQTTGIFSRWDFHHPGPFLLWMKAIGNSIGRVTPLSPFGGQMLVNAVLVAVSLGLLVVVLDGLLDRWILSACAYTLAAVFGAGSWTNPWAPATATWLVLAGIAALGGSAGARRWAFPVAVAAGTAALHLHVLVAPAGVMIVAAAIVLRWWRRGDHTDRRDVVVGASVAGVMLLPLLVAVVAGDSYWADYFHASDEHAGVAFKRQWSAALGGLVESATPMRIAPYRFVDARHGLDVVIGYGMVAAAVVGAVVAVWRRVTLAIAVTAAAALGWLAYLVAISRYAFVGQMTGGTIVMVSLLMPLIASCAPPQQAPHRWMLAPVAAIIAAAMLTGSLTTRPQPFDGTAERALATVMPVGSTLIVDHSTDDGYVAAAALVLLALRRDLEVCVPEVRWPYWAGRDLLCEPGVDGVRVTFGSGTDFTMD